MFRYKPAGKLNSSALPRDVRWTWLELPIKLSKTTWAWGLPISKEDNGIISVSRALDDDERNRAGLSLVLDEPAESILPRPRIVALR